MAGFKNGAEFVKALREKGCPETKLQVARDVLKRVSATEHRVPTADEVVQGMEAFFGPDHKTVQKAKAFAAGGDYADPVQPMADPIEEQLLAHGAEKDPAKDEGEKHKASAKKAEK